MTSATSNTFLDQTLPAWQQQFDHLARRIARLLPRVEVRQQAKDYLKALLSPIERKNSWQVAEGVGHTTPYKVQHLLGRSRWDADAVRDEVRSYVVTHLGEQDGVLILDETGFLKKGDKSCGVARQYSGTAGKTENCQIGVFLCYASSKGQALIDRALYLPEGWTQDEPRCHKAKVPAGTRLVTKPKIGRQMLERAFAAAVPCRWVTADAVYGNDRSLQLWLQERGQAHVLAVTGQEMVYTGSGGHRVKALLSAIPEAAWQRLSCGAGAKGERLFEWAWLEVNQGQGPAWKAWLLVRRSLADPSERSAFRAFAPADTPLEALVQAAGRRWGIECAFEQAKGEVGLDQYEVRSWQGWHRHVTLAMAALAYLAVVRAGELDARAVREVVREWDATREATKGGPLFPGRKTGSTGSLGTFKQARGLSPSRPQDRLVSGRPASG
jgi:SRSO17 transposase